MLDWGKLDFEPGWLLLHHYTTKRAKIWIFFNHFFPLLLPEVATIPINYFLQINFSIVTLSKNYYDIDKLFPINWLWEFYAWSLTKIELQIHHREYLLLKLITARLWQWLNLPNKKKSNHQVFVSTPTGRNSWELSATLSECVCTYSLHKRNRRYQAFDNNLQISSPNSVSNSIPETQETMRVELILTHFHHITHSNAT